jgi:hypothetical protein
MSTVRGDWVALTGPVWVTLDSMVIMNELGKNVSIYVIVISTKDCLLWGSILNLDEGDLELGKVENGLYDGVHFDCCLVVLVVKWKGRESAGYL